MFRDSRTLLFARQCSVVFSQFRPVVEAGCAKRLLGGSDLTICMKLNLWLSQEFNVTQFEIKYLDSVIYNETNLSVTYVFHIAKDYLCNAIMKSKF